MSEQTADLTSVESPEEKPAGRRAGRPPEKPAAAQPLSEEMDRLSLEQTLRDFELANARVLDLTQRLVTATNEINSLRHQLETLRIEHAALVAEDEEMQRSRAYKAARIVSGVRRTLRS